MFAGKAGAVRWSAQVDAEVRYQIKRLSHHASIALWDACNECKVRDRRFAHHPSVTRPVCTRQIFYPWWKPVLPTVAAVDKSRPIWPASPSNGWVSGVERLTSRPTGSRLAANSHWRAPGVGGYPWAQESHGPYTGFMRAAHASAPSADRCFVSSLSVSLRGQAGSTIGRYRTPKRIRCRPVGWAAGTIRWRCLRGQDRATRAGARVNLGRTAGPASRASRPSCRVTSIRSAAPPPLIVTGTCQ